MPSSLELTLDFSRSEEADDPYAFRFHSQTYQRRFELGAVKTESLDWSDPEFRADLAELGKPQLDNGVLQRVGHRLRNFLSRLDWKVDENKIEGAVARREPIHVTVRSAAAELYSLPWELLTLEDSGKHLGELPGCLINYEWPLSSREAGPPPPQGNGRVIVAWSAAGGEVPAAEHVRALAAISRRSGYAFDEQVDVVSSVSRKSLVETLKSTDRPISALHILCHGANSPTGTFGLAFDSNDAGEEADIIDAGTLRRLLQSPFPIGMVVICACHSGDAGTPANPLGGVAQVLHRQNIPVVIASRMLLSTKGSVLLTQTLYGELIEQGRTVREAVLSARTRLADEIRYPDWASLQVYARSMGGCLETRPFRAAEPLVLLAGEPQPGPSVPDPADEQPVRPVAFSEVVVAARVDEPPAPHVIGTAALREGQDPGRPSAEPVAEEAVPRAVVAPPGAASWTGHLMEALRSGRFLACVVVANMVICAATTAMALAAANQSLSSFVLHALFGTRVGFIGGITACVSRRGPPAIRVASWLVAAMLAGIAAELAIGDQFTPMGTRSLDGALLGLAVCLLLVAIRLLIVPRLTSFPRSAVGVGACAAAGAPIGVLVLTMVFDSSGLICRAWKSMFEWWSLSSGLWLGTGWGGALGLAEILRRQFQASSFPREKVRSRHSWRRSDLDPIRPPTHDSPRAPASSRA